MPRQTRAIIRELDASEELEVALVADGAGDVREVMFQKRHDSHAGTGAIRVYVEKPADALETSGSSAVSLGSATASNYDTFKTLKVPCPVCR